MHVWGHKSLLVECDVIEGDKKNFQVEDLRSHIQRYVNEVKRIEELLALREKERMELLDQVKINLMSFNVLHTTLKYKHSNYQTVQHCIVLIRFFAV
jgi:hypothetical protein